MGGLLLKILGVETEGGAGIDSLGFNFLNLGPLPFMLILAAILIGLTVFLYMKELETLNRRLRLILAGLRIIIILFLL